MSDMVDELVELRKIKDQITVYGTKHTKLEAIFHPETVVLLKAEIEKTEKNKKGVGI